MRTTWLKPRHKVRMPADYSYKPRSSLQGLLRCNEFSHYCDTAIVQALPFKHDIDQGYDYKNTSSVVNSSIVVVLQNLPRCFGHYNMR